MKSQPLLIIILIALGAMTGSTLATITYLNRQQSASIIQNPSPQPTPPSSTPNSTLNPQPTPSTNQASSLQPKPSDFSQFRLRLLEAIKRRDANFIRALITPQTQWNFGGTLNLNSYKIDNPQSPFWQYIVKAVGAGCTVEPNATVPEQEAGSEIWVCPETTGQLIYNFGWQDRVAILGQNVNVRSQPDTGSSIVGVLSKELVQFDAQTFTNLPQQRQEAVNTPEGWTPVILLNGKPGWVQNSFVYYEPRDYRVSFFRSRGQWRLRYFFQGDGN